MRLRLNIPQRVAVFAASGAIIIFQIVSFASDGVEGHGWVFSFLVVGVLLFIGLASNPSEKSLEPAARAPADPATLALNKGARAMATLSAEMASQLEQYFKNNNLQPALNIPGSSPAIESIFPVFALASVAYLETNSPALTTEFILFREIFAKAAGGFIAQDMDSWEKNHFRGVAPPQGVAPISTQLPQQILALTNTRISSQYELARRCIALQSKSDPQPLLPIYRSVAVGSKCSDEELKRRFESLFVMILGSFRRELASHYAT